MSDLLCGIWSITFILLAIKIKSLKYLHCFEQSLFESLECSIKILWVFFIQILFTLLHEESKLTKPFSYRNIDINVKRMHDWLEKISLNE